MTGPRLTWVFLAAILLSAALIDGPVSRSASKSALAGAVHNAPVQACDILGTIWVEGEVVDYSSPTTWAWNGRWVRRGNSNVFDAIWIHRNGQKGVSPLTITAQGNQIRIERPGCVYTGTLVGSGVQGTYRCERGGVNYWSANIGCEPGAGGCGLGNEWRVNDTIVPGVFNPGWVGVWTRHGTSNVFLSKAYRQGEPEGRATIAVTIDGNKVLGQRKDEPNKYKVTDCVYEGFLIGQGGAATGTVTCNSGVGRLGPYFWDAKILCGGISQGGGNDQGGGGGGGSGGCAGTPINWIFNVTESKYQIGQRYTFCCNSEVQGLADVYGTNVYTSDSRVCAAALHAGVISKAGGSVTIEMRPGQEEYIGRPQNGVTSRSYGRWPVSFAVIGAKPVVSSGGGNGGGGNCQSGQGYSLRVSPNTVRAGGKAEIGFTFPGPRPGNDDEINYWQPITTSSGSQNYGELFARSVRDFVRAGLCRIPLEVPANAQPGEYELKYVVGLYGTGTPRTVAVIKFSVTGSTGLPQKILQSGNWAGNWSQNLSNGAYASTISLSGNSLRASFQYQNGHSTGTGQWNCTVTGNTARGYWTESYNDPDKSAQRRGTLQATINGDTITGQALEDEPVFSWRTSPYTSAMRKGAVWPISLTRRR